MSEAKRTVIIGTSLTEASDEVVAKGLAVACALDATARVVHAYPLPAAYYGTPAGLTAVHPRMLDAERGAQVEATKAQLERAGAGAATQADAVIEMGPAHRLLLDSAETLDAALLVVGASEATGRFAPLLGSTADRVLRKSPIPVLVVRPGLKVPPRRVLAPVDLSPLSEDALRRGLEWLAALGVEPDGCSVTTLFVLSEIERDGSLQFEPEQIERLAREELERFDTRVDPDGAWCLDATVRHGLPRHEILAALEEKRENEDEAYDLVLLGTHGHGGFERLLLGSVASSVSRAAPASVLVIPPAAATVESGDDDNERAGAGG